MEKEKTMTPTEWEIEVKKRLNEYIDNMLSVAKDCNMATKYFYAPKEVYETHTDFDKSKIDGAELRIIFNFADSVDATKVEFV